MVDSSILDTTYPVETPEGVRINLLPAGPAVRAVAWLIDAFIRGAVFFFLGLFLMNMGKLASGLAMILGFLIWWFYPVFFEVWNKGQTPGKRVMKIAVTRVEGTPIGWQASLLRNLLRMADFLPVCYGVGLVSVLFSKSFQRLGDMVAGTLVVYRNAPSHQVISLPDSTPKPPPRSLSLAEQRAVIHFGESAYRLSRERQVELADILQDLTGQSGEKGCDRLHQYAAWCGGKRS